MLLKCSRGSGRKRGGYVLAGVCLRQKKVVWCPTDAAVGGHKQRMLAKRYVILEEGLSFFGRGMEDGAQ